MNSLFAGFDLAMEPSKTAVVETRVKKGKVTHEAINMTNQSLFPISNYKFF